MPGSGQTANDNFAMVTSPSQWFKKFAMVRTPNREFRNQSSDFRWPRRPSSQEERKSPQERVQHTLRQAGVCEQRGRKALNPTHSPASRCLRAKWEFLAPGVQILQVTGHYPNRKKERPVFHGLRSPAASLDQSGRLHRGLASPVSNSRSSLPGLMSTLSAPAREIAAPASPKRDSPRGAASKVCLNQGMPCW